MRGIEPMGTCDLAVFFSRKKSPAANSGTWDAICVLNSLRGGKRSTIRGVSIWQRALLESVRSDMGYLYTKILIACIDWC
jgi:hypothetical protein